MSNPLLTDDPAIAEDLAWLLENDPFFKDHFPSGFALSREKGIGGIHGLIRIILGQQVSTAAARSLWGKFTNRFNPSDYQSLLDAPDEDFRACGLSRQKIGYVRGLAHALLKGTIDPLTWAKKDDAAMTAEITALKGFGLWSAQMYLMFHLARRDIWPAGDLGIQSGLQIYLGLEARPNEKETLAAYPRFKGRATAASLLLWSIKDGGI